MSPFSLRVIDQVNVVYHGNVLHKFAVMGEVHAVFNGEDAGAPSMGALSVAVAAVDHDQVQCNDQFSPTVGSGADRRFGFQVPQFSGPQKRSFFLLRYKVPSALAAVPLR